MTVLRAYLPGWRLPASIALVAALVASLLATGGADTADAIDPADVDTVYIATGTNFADALMGATLATSNNSPMLGVAPDAIPAETARELDRLTRMDDADPGNDMPLSKIFIFGGSAAVSDAVALQLEAWADDVERIFGTNRFGTYEAISQALPPAVQNAVDAEQAANADKLDGQDSTAYLREYAHAGGGVTSIDDPSNSELPGSEIQITVPTGHTADVVLEFSAESMCRTTGAGADWCQIFFFQDGSSIGHNDLAFDSSDNGSEGSFSWESHSTRIVAEGLSAGTYTFTIVRNHFDGGSDDTVTFRLDDWLFTADAIITS